MIGNKNLVSGRVSRPVPRAGRAVGHMENGAYLNIRLTPLDFFGKRPILFINVNARRWTARKGWREIAPARGRFILEPDFAVTFDLKIGSPLVELFLANLPQSLPKRSDRILD